MSESIRVFAPATISNLGPGFDILGIAVASLGDTVVARRAPERGVRIQVITGADALPLDPEKNTAAIAAAATLRRAGIEAGVELELHKGLPIGSGLGSSAASAVAAAYATNLLLGSPLRKPELIEPCLEAEAAVAGRHGDNVAPSLLGGLILVRSLDPVDVVRLPIPDGLTLVVVTPDFSLPTREARAVLPREVPLSATVEMAANLGALVAACASGDLGLMARAMTDRIVEPRRADLIPGARAVIEAARHAGALGSSISGAGPSIFAICRSARSGQEAAEAMRRAFAAHGLAATAHLSPADCPGARRV